MNTFMNELNNSFNYTRTTNGALAHKSTLDAVYDMFAQAGAYRQASDEDCILLFKSAYEENPDLAMKCLFYERDARGGQGERRFFRVCFKWLCNTHPDSAIKNLKYVSDFGRWDDVLYATEGTSVFPYALTLIDKQLSQDCACSTPSLLAKWLPSINASSVITKEMAHEVRKFLGMTERQYRQMLSELRERLKVVERLMSENRWDEIDFSKIPSKAGLIYRNAFARRGQIKEKYEAFIKDASTKVNAKTLYPYEIVRDVVSNIAWDGNFKAAFSDIDRQALNKYWENLPDYFNGKSASMMCVVDTSASMTWGLNNVQPIDIAISLGIYCGERLNGPFKNHFISFSSHPKLIKIEGIDFADKVRRIHNQNLCENTDLSKVFSMLKEIALTPGVRKNDIPKTILIISDMQIDAGSTIRGSRDSVHAKVKTEMENIRKDWENHGLTMPHLVYWNVNAVNKANILDDGPNVSYVSGCSPTIFMSVLTGKTGKDLMMEVLNNKRYEVIRA